MGARIAVLLLVPPNSVGHEDAVRKSSQRRAENSQPANRKEGPNLDRTLRAETAANATAMTPRELCTSVPRDFGYIDCKDHSKSEATEQSEPGPDGADVAKELVGILASKTFAKAFRQRQLLSWIVNRWLERRGDQLDPYTIATAVFRRGTGFDPSIDPIVRVEASRLRRHLQKYYSGEGSGSSLRIELPSRTYTPQVRHVPLRTRAIAGQLRARVTAILILSFDGIEASSNETEGDASLPGR
jgi:hypothetical protein